MKRETSKSDDVEHRIAGIDWTFNSWGGKHRDFLTFIYLLGCVIWGLIKGKNQCDPLNWLLGLCCWCFNWWTFIQCLGLEDGCYSDWSLDALVKKKVRLFISVLAVVVTYWFWYYHHMFSRFWKLRGFLDFHNLWCLKVEASMWMEKVRVNAVIFQHDGYPTDQLLWLNITVHLNVVSEPIYLWTRISGS